MYLAFLSLLPEVMGYLHFIAVMVDLVTAVCIMYLSFAQYDITAIDIIENTFGLVDRYCTKSQFQLDSLAYHYAILSFDISHVHNALPRIRCTLVGGWIFQLVKALPTHLVFLCNIILHYPGHLAVLISCFSQILYCSCDT